MRLSHILTTALAAGLVACGGANEPLSVELDALSDTDRDLTRVEIPDNDPDGIRRQIELDLSGEVVVGLRVVALIEHTYRGDLKVSLRSPRGTQVVLHNQAGANAQDLELDATFFDEFAGEPASGAWTLEVADLASWDTGVLVGWAILVQSEPAPNPCAAVRCGRDEVCQLQAVECVRAPCPELAVCVNPCAAAICPQGSVCEVQQGQAVCAAEPTPCQPSDCGAPPPVAPLVCDDGTIGTQVSCERDAAGSCQWSVTQECPEPRQGQFCGTRGEEVYCGASEYCHYTVNQTCGWADAKGECRARPEICTREMRPVCGCDNRTYSNRCGAHGAGVSVQYEGRCQAQWDREAVRFDTGDPYANDQRTVMEFDPPRESERVKINFARFDTEQNYDFVLVLDAQGNEITRYHGTIGPFETEIDVPGGSFSVVFESDYSVTRSGVSIDWIEWAY